MGPGLFFYSGEAPCIGRVAQGGGTGSENILFHSPPPPWRGIVMDYQTRLPPAPTGRDGDVTLFSGFKNISPRERDTCSGKGAERQGPGKMEAAFSTSGQLCAQLFLSNRFSAWLAFVVFFAPSSGFD